MSQREIVPSQDFFKYAENAVEEELVEAESATNKKKLWEKMGSELEISGYPKYKISTKIQEVIEDKLETKLGYQVKINTAHYYRVMSKNEWQDSSYARNTNTVDPLGDQNNSSLNTKFSEENKKFIGRIKDSMDNFHNILSYLKQNPFASLVDEDGTDELFLIWDNSNRNMREHMSDKQKIPIYSQEILINAYFTSYSGDRMTEKYFDEIKRVHLLNPGQSLQYKCDEIISKITELKKVQKTSDDEKIRDQIFKLNEELDKIKKKQNRKAFSGKRLKQLVYGEIPTMLEYLEPHDVNHARSRGFFGQQCPKCRGFRTVSKPDGGRNDILICMKCTSQDKSFTIKKIPFLSCKTCHRVITDEHLEKIENTKLCVYCNNELILPTPAN